VWRAGYVHPCHLLLLHPEPAGSALYAGLALRPGGLLEPSQAGQLSGTSNSHEIIFLIHDWNLHEPNNSQEPLLLIDILFNSRSDSELSQTGQLLETSQAHEIIFLNSRLEPSQAGQLSGTSNSHEIIFLIHDWNLHEPNNSQEPLMLIDILFNSRSDSELSQTGQLLETSQAHEIILNSRLEPSQAGQLSGTSNSHEIIFLIHDWNLHDLNNCQEPLMLINILFNSRSDSELSQIGQLPGTSNSHDLNFLIHCWNLHELKNSQETSHAHK
jgi:hypothetical protein